jgi:hypothetical protein
MPMNRFDMHEDVYCRNQSTTPRAYCGLLDSVGYSWLTRFKLSDGIMYTPKLPFVGSVVVKSPTEWTSLNPLGMVELPSPIYTSSSQLKSARRLIKSLTFITSPLYCCLSWLRLKIKRYCAFWYRSAILRKVDCIS